MIIIGVNTTQAFYSFFQHEYYRVNFLSWIIPQVFHLNVSKITHTTTHSKVFN